MSQQQKMDREWVVMLAEYGGDEEAFRRAVTEELAGLENMGHRTGGAYVATPIRVREEVNRNVIGLPPTEFVTIGWHFKQAFMPAARVVDDPPAREEAPELDELPAAEPVAT